MHSEQTRVKIAKSNKDEPPIKEGMGIIDGWSGCVIRDNELIGIFEKRKRDLPKNAFWITKARNYIV